MNLIELALTTYTEGLGAADDQADALFEEQRNSFLAAARMIATNRLGSAADELVWTYTSPAELPDDTEEATAPLAPGRPEYLRFRYNTADDSESFALVQPCHACGQDRIAEVPGLTRLGELLHQEEAHQDDVGGEEAKRGPLTAVEAAEQRAASVSVLAGHLLADHSDAGLMVDTVAVFGHEDAGGSALLRLKATGLDALRRVAVALGLEVTDHVSGTHPGMVFKHATATYTADDIEVQLRAHDRLSDDEAAAWIAQQDQPRAEASAGGDV